MTNNIIINDIVKVYPHMTKIIIYHRSYQLTLEAKRTKPEENKKPQTKKDNKNIDRSIRRTKTIVKDLILSNKFDYFCTFTFDKLKHNRYDIDHCKLTMMMWLNRQKKHSPNLKYIIVPELHKDGALHFHALIANYNGKLKPLNKKTKTGAPIYNISSYRAGRISSAVPIDQNIEAVTSYILKQYMTKDMPSMFHKKRYWASRNLQRPTTIVNGVNALNLNKIIKNQKPAYINEYLEVQHHNTKGSKIDKASLAIDLPF